MSQKYGIDDKHLLTAVRTILLTEEQARLKAIERRIEIIIGQWHSQYGSLAANIEALLQDLTDLHITSRENENRQRDLALQVEILRRKAQADSEGLLARLTPIFSDLIGRQIRDSREEMAEALGPVMGEAIRVQIRDSRRDMVEALYPVIGETVQRAVGEFAREFQHNIDARLKAAFGPEGLLRTLSARLRGISPGELALRDVLPFNIREIFLIQRESGMLLAHSHPGTSDISDSDLISGMLTAIRDFVYTSFSHGDDTEELDEIQYGRQKIIIQSGRVAYLAVVIIGVEPEGFNATNLYTYPNLYPDTHRNVYCHSYANCNCNPYLHANHCDSNSHSHTSRCYHG